MALNRRIYQDKEEHQFLVKLISILWLLLRTVFRNDPISKGTIRGFKEEQAVIESYLHDQLDELNDLAEHIE